MPRVKGAVNRPKTDEYLIDILKARGYFISKEKPAPPAPDPGDHPLPANLETLTIKVPAAAAAAEKILNTCGLCGGKFAGKPARCPKCGAQFSGWKEAD